MIKILAMCLIVAATAGTCEECGKQIDKAVSDVKTAVATYVPTQPPARHTTYLAMGDSVPAGTDLGSPCPHTGETDCVFSYPSLIAFGARLKYDSSLSVTNLTCSGATSGEVNGSGPQVSGCPSQVDALSPSVTFVTVTVGADELMNWIIKNWTCVANPAVTDWLKSWREACDMYQRVIVPVTANVKEILAKVTARSDLVVITEYYHIFRPEDKGFRDWNVAVNSAIDLLDDAIADAARPYGQKVIPVDLRPVFKGHEWGSSDSYITPRLNCGVVDVTCAAVPGVHPTLDGQQAIAKAIWTKLEPRLPR